MRKIVSELEEDERQALIVLCDFGVASFSAALAVEVLRAFVIILFT
jgi:dihydroxyacetone kinase DhaKLM complex PTS-EIIA-like component DhaM